MQDLHCVQIIKGSCLSTFQYRPDFKTHLMHIKRTDYLLMYLEILRDNKFN